MSEWIVVSIATALALIFALCVWWYEGPLPNDDEPATPSEDAGTKA